jgi:hypothetical protein
VIGPKKYTRANRVARPPCRQESSRAPSVFCHIHRARPSPNTPESYSVGSRNTAEVCTCVQNKRGGKRGYAFRVATQAVPPGFGTSMQQQGHPASLALVEAESCLPHGHPARAEPSAKPIRSALDPIQPIYLEPFETARHDEEQRCSERDVKTECPHFQRGNGLFYDKQISAHRIDPAA